MTKMSAVLIFGLFAAAFGWQLALFWPPNEYQFAGWVVAGICALTTGLVAAKGG